jgi:hypothetical protein
MGTTETSNNSAANMNTSRKIDALLKIGAGEIIENTLNKLIQYQLAKYRDNINQIKREMEKFEKSYNMSSDIFYQEFEAGKLGDEGDYFEWSSLYENVLLYEDRIEKWGHLLPYGQSTGSTGKLKKSH